MLLKSFFLFFFLTSGYENTLFEEVSCCDHSIGIQLTILFHLLDSLKVLFGRLVCANIGITGAVLDGVAYLFTAEAANVFDWLGLIAALSL